MDFLCKNPGGFLRTEEVPTLLSLIEDIEGISDMVSHFRIFHKRHTGNSRHGVPKDQLFN